MVPRAYFLRWKTDSYPQLAVENKTQNWKSYVLLPQAERKGCGNSQGASSCALFVSTYWANIRWNWSLIMVVPAHKFYRFLGRKSYVMYFSWNSQYSECCWKMKILAWGKESALVFYTRARILLTRFPHRKVSTLVSSPPGPSVCIEHFTWRTCTWRRRLSGAFDHFSSRLARVSVGRTRPSRVTSLPCVGKSLLTQRFLSIDHQTAEKHCFLPRIGCCSVLFLTSQRLAC